MKSLGCYLNFLEQQKLDKIHEKLNRFDKKKYRYKRKQLRDKLNIGEKVLVLAERIKKSVPWKFYKQSVQNIAYFNSGMTFSIRKRETIDKFNYYWLINLRNNKILTKRFFTYFWHVKIAN